jgi:hypothetical protein
MVEFTSFQITSIAGVSATALWAIIYTLNALLGKKIKSKMYRWYVTILLIVYCVYIGIHFSFLMIEFDPMGTNVGPWSSIRYICSSTMFLCAVGLDSLVLQLFKVLDSRITPRRLANLRFSFLALYLITLVFGLLSLIFNNNPLLYAMTRFSRLVFVISVCIYDEIQNVFITILVYFSLSKHSKQSSKTLQYALYLISFTYPIDVFGALCFLLSEIALPTSPLFRYKFELLNGMVMSIGIHFTFMVMLFCGLVNLTFSEKGKIYTNRLPSGRETTKLPINRT